MNPGTYLGGGIATQRRIIPSNLKTEYFDPCVFCGMYITDKNIHKEIFWSAFSRIFSNNIGIVMLKLIYVVG